MSDKIKFKYKYDNEDYLLVNTFINKDGEMCSLYRKVIRQIIIRTKKEIIVIGDKVKKISNEKEEWEKLIKEKR